MTVLTFVACLVSFRSNKLELRGSNVPRTVRMSVSGPLDEKIDTPHAFRINIKQHVDSG